MTIGPGPRTMDDFEEEARSRCCKHGHVDGAMHVPCPECRTEHLQARVAKLEDALRHILAIKDIGVDGTDEKGVFRNWPETERDAMYRVATEALIEVPPFDIGTP